MENNLINELRSLIESDMTYSKEELNRRVKDLLFRVLIELRRLEETTRDKSNLIERHANERKNLIKKLNEAAKGEQKAYERLADLDITRHAYVAELGQEMEKLKAEKEKLIAKENEIINGAFKNDKAIEELKREVEKKNLQLKEMQEDLNSALQTYRESESKFKLLENELKAIRNSNMDSVERNYREEIIEEGIAMLDNLEKDSDEKVRRDSEGIISSKNNEIAALKEQADMFSFGKNELSRKLEDVNRDFAIVKSDNKKLLEKLSELKNELDALKAEKDSEIQKVKEHEKDIIFGKGSLINEFENVQEELSLLKDEKDKLYGKLSDVMEELDRVKNEKTEQASAFRHDIESMRVEVKHVKEELDAKEADFKKTIEAKEENERRNKDAIEHLSGETRSLKPLNEELEKKLVKAINENTEKEKIINSLEEKNREHLNTITSMELELSGLKSQKDAEITGQADISKEMAGLKGRLEDVEKENVILRAEKDRLSVQVDGISKKPERFETGEREKPSVKTEPEPAILHAAENDGATAEKHPHSAERGGLSHDDTTSVPQKNMHIYRGSGFNLKMAAAAIIVLVLILMLLGIYIFTDWLPLPKNKGKADVLPVTPSRQQTSSSLP